MTRFPRSAADAAAAILLVAICAAAGPREPAVHGTAARSEQAAPQAATTPERTVPNRPGSVKFAAIGDTGTGGRAEYEVAHELTEVHGRFPFDLVIMLGDNMYGSQEPEDFVAKFERPFKALLDSGVEFRAALGNHDRRTNRFYEPFHMDGQRYYTFSRKNVRFFALDSDYMDREQLDWLGKELKSSREDWKICYFHHPLYSDGGRHGSAMDLRVVLEPLFMKYGVNVVYSGHDHIYERIKPQNGIAYFVSGAGGQLREGDLRRSGMTAAGFDADRSFMINEVAGDDLYFEAISRTGRTVDSGTIRRSQARTTEGGPGVLLWGDHRTYARTPTRIVRGSPIVRVGVRPVSYSSSNRFSTAANTSTPRRRRRDPNRSKT